MQTPASDKMMRPVETKDNLTDFFFPEYSITIKAVSYEEALQKLEEILKAKTNQTK